MVKVKVGFVGLLLRNSWDGSVLSKAQVFNN